MVDYVEINMVLRGATTTATSIASATSAAVSAATSEAIAACSTSNDYDGRLGLRISAIFVILLGSMSGACFPVYAQKNKGVRVPEWAFFIAKYFGSGVIVATAFIHLLSPANVALSDPCLTGIITEYEWAEGIVLMTIFTLFFTELMAMRYSTFGHTHDDDDEHDLPVRTLSLSSGHGHAPGDDHLGHSREHPDDEELFAVDSDKLAEDYAAQMTAIFILEFGVIFHSIFVGLTLAVAGGEQFNTLYVVLVFHQTFEGLGLGSRLAVTPWNKTKKWTPYLLGMAYGFSTPIAMAVGLGLRETYTPGSATALIVNGCFDSVSAGILIYTGLVELMAHEFMFSPVMRKARLSVVLSAFGCMVLGAGLMAVLGKWA